MKKVVIAVLVILFIVLVLIASNSIRKNIDSVETKPIEDTPNIEYKLELSLNQNWLKLNKDKINEIHFVESYTGEASEATTLDHCNAFLKEGTLYICVQNGTKVTNDLAFAFKDFSELKKIQGLELLDFSSVTSMDSTFENSGLEEINLSEVNLSNLINANKTFYQASRLKHVALPMSLQSLRNTSYMFSKCGDLNSIDFGNARLNLNNAEYMFEGAGRNFACDISKLKIDSIYNLKGFFYQSHLIDYQAIIDNMDLSKADDLTSMFEGIQTNQLDISKWDTSSVTKADRLFYNLDTLLTLNVSNLDFSSLESCQGMFYNCTNIKDLNLNWKLSNKLKNTVQMFYGCSSLKELDVSCFDGLTIVDAEEMFYGCGHLTHIYGNGFITFASRNMFTYCSLSEGNEILDGTMAQADTGYFTKK